MSENNIIAAILAGGKSRRFGVDKSTAKLGSKTLLEHTIEIINDNFFNRNIEADVYFTWCSQSVDYSIINHILQKNIKFA